MNNSIKTWWMKDKEKAEGGGIALLLLGLLILILGVILSFKPDYDELWLIGISIGVISIALGFIAIGMSAKTEKYKQMMLETIHGQITQEFSAQFDLARIVNKVKLTETGKEFIIYNSSANIGMRDVPFLFGNAWIGLENMKEKDIVRIRVYIKEDTQKYQISEDEDNTCKGIQRKPVRIDGNFYNQYGIEITAEHLAADSSPLEISCYAYDAARGG